MNNIITEYRLKLRAAGFAPVPVAGKAPLIKGWQRLASASESDIEGWIAAYPHHTNTGILTSLTPVVDIDITDPVASDACWHLICDRFGDTGRVLERFGRRPKRAVPFQTAKAFSKIGVSLVAANGDTSQKIEVLCDGQQVVVDGIHPDTRQPYEWPGGAPGAVSRYDLPCINQAEVELLVRDLVELLRSEHGYKIAEGRPKPSTNGNGRPDYSYSGDDWQFLIDGIASGSSLHDNTRDLAAKLVAGGLKSGATVNLIRGLMTKSAAPKDERYYARVAAIPRLVESAAEKFEYKEPAPATAVTKVELLSSAAFVASYRPPDYLINGLLQRQYFYSVTGKTGGGKTAVALYLAYLIACGGTLDGKEAVRGKVLYLAGENPVDVQQRWIAMSQQLDFDYKTIDMYFIPGVFSVSEMQAEISAQVERLGGVALVVIDTTAAYFEGDDENNNVQAGQYARMQRGLVKLPGGPTVLALCHPVKNASDDCLEPRGGGAYLNETDGNLTVQNDDGVVKLHHSPKFRGSYFAAIPFQLKGVTHEMLRDTNGHLIGTVVAFPMSDDSESAFRTATRNAENEVLLLVREERGLSLSEIAGRLTWTKSRAQRTVDRLKKQHLLEFKRGELGLTKAGREVVERLQNG